MHKLLKLPTATLFAFLVTGCVNPLDFSDGTTRKHLKSHTYSSSEVVSYVNYNCDGNFRCDNYPAFNSNIVANIKEIERLVGNVEIQTFDVEGLKGFVLQLKSSAFIFDYGKSKLSNGLKDALTGISKALVGNENLYNEVIVYGHASHDGLNKSQLKANVIESKRRAGHAANYLAVSLNDYGFNKKSNQFVKAQSSGDKYSSILKIAGDKISLKKVKNDQRTDVIFILKTPNK